MKIINHKQGAAMVTALRRSLASVYDMGEDPNEAVAKEAAAVELTPEFTKRLCEAFNRASADVHRKKASDDTERVSPYPIADPEVVVEKLWPSQVEEPEEKEAEWVYAGTDLFYGEQEPDFSELDKWIQSEKEKQADESEEEKITDRGLWEAHKVLRATLDDCYTKLANLKFALSGTVKKVADTIREHYDADFDDLDRRTAAVLGDLGVDILNRAYKRAGIKREVNVTEDKTASWQPGPIYDELLHACEVCKKVRKEAESLNATVKKAFLGMVVKPFIYAKMRNAATPQGMPDKLDSLVGLEQEVDKLKTMKNLSALIADDPVIGRYPPEAVLLAVNEVIDSYPSLKTDPVALRTTLRKLLEGEGAMDTFDINNLVTYEKNRAATKSVQDKVIEELGKMRELGVVGEPPKKKDVFEELLNKADKKPRPKPAPAPEKPKNPEKPEEPNA